MFVRHGETEWNRNNRTMGRLDAPLTAKGITDAIRGAKKIRGQHIFDHIVSSPLGRALETATIFAKEFDVDDIQVIPELAERDLGVLQGLTKKQSIQQFPHYYDTNEKFIHSSEIKDGETLGDFLDRVKVATNKLVTLSQNKSVLVVTHDGVLNAIVGFVKGIEFGRVRDVYTFKHGVPISLN